jgi:hypothetical protein
LCSLAPEFELREKASRLDDLAQQSLLSFQDMLPTAVSSTQELLGSTFGTSSGPGASSASIRPTLGKRASSASTIATMNSFGHSPAPPTTQSTPGLLPGNSNGSSANLGSTGGLGAILSTSSVLESSSASSGSLFKPLRLTAEDIENKLPIRGPSPSPHKRPGLGPRATSFNAAFRQNISSTPHRRTGSHSPGLSDRPRPRVPSPPSTQPTVQPTAIDRESIGVWVKGVTSQQRLDPHLHTYLSSINAFSMPLRPNREALLRLYCDSVDKILPLLDKEQFLKLHNIGQAPTLLLHAVLLVAARHPRASQYLGHESVRQFCATTAAKIRTLLYAEVEQDRLTLVRIYALLSLHSEGPDGLENSCSDLQKALHYATSLGIHLERPFIEKQQLSKLWWSIWCMDRISACVNARPLIIHNEDIGVPMIQQQNEPQLFRLMAACSKLEKVIHLYRPGVKETVVPVEVDQLFMGDDTIDPLNAIHGLLHHTAVILAHKRVSTAERQKFQEETVVTQVAGNRITPLALITDKLKMEPGDVFKKFEDNFLADDDFSNDVDMDFQPPPATETVTDGRLLSAAGSVLRIIRNSKDLPPLPLLPYCVSLTLTVFLRTYPRGDSETGFSWKDSCSTLEGMADRWWVAGAMGTMGRNVFKSLEDESKQAAAAQLAVPTTAPNATVNDIRMEEQYLNMFSDLPNQTSFIDQALSLDAFDNVEQWFQEKR